MKTNLKRKNYYLDENKIRRARTILGLRVEILFRPFRENRPGC